MSRFCGKCDLYDSVFMIKRDQYNDESDLECFERFKKETGGVIYKSIHIELTPYNVDHECSLTDPKDEYGLFKIPHTEVKQDLRCKNKQKTTTTYTYKYLTREFKSLKALNKHGYFRKEEIKLTSLLDFVPYFTHLIGAEFSSEGHRHIIISNKSYIDTMIDQGREYGYDNSKFIDICKRELKKYVVDLIKEEKQYE